MTTARIPLCSNFITSTPEGIVPSLSCPGKVGQPVCCSWVVQNPTRGRRDIGVTIKEFEVKDRDTYRILIRDLKNHNNLWIFLRSVHEPDVHVFTGSDLVKININLTMRLGYQPFTISWERGKDNIHHYYYEQSGLIVGGNNNYSWHIVEMSQIHIHFTCRFVEPGDESELTVYDDDVSPPRVLMTIGGRYDCRLYSSCSTNTKRVTVKFETGSSYLQNRPRVDIRWTTAHEYPALSDCFGGLSDVAVAFVILGPCVVVFIVAMVICFKCWKRRNNSHNKSTEPIVSGTARFSQSPPGTGVSTIRLSTRVTYSLNTSRANESEIRDNDINERFSCKGPLAGLGDGGAQPSLMVDLEPDC